MEILFGKLNLISVVILIFIYEVIKNLITNSTIKYLEKQKSIISEKLLAKKTREKKEMLDKAQVISKDTAEMERFNFHYFNIQFHTMRTYLTTIIFITIYIIILLTSGEMARPMTYGEIFIEIGAGNYIYLFRLLFQVVMFVLAFYTLTLVNDLSKNRTIYRYAIALNKENQTHKEQ